MNINLTLFAQAAVFLAFMVYLARGLIPVLYSETPGIQVAASALLAWVAFYHVADAGQAISAFMLRCYRITITPLALYGVGLWGLGLYGGYLLTYEGLPGYPAMQSAKGFWVASTVAIAFVSASLVFMLWRAACKRAEQPS